MRWWVRGDGGMRGRGWDGVGRMRWWGRGWVGERRWWDERVGGCR